MPEYALILLIFLVTALALKKRYNIRVYTSTKHLVVMNLFFLAIGIIWDHVAIGRGHWYFGEQFLLGPRIGLMPLEEYGFTFILPFFVLVLYRLIEKKT